MIVRVLGSAAGGGVPQWNCGCGNCAAARAGRIPCRTQSSIAVSGFGTSWFLINAAPDVAAQIEAFEPLQPRGVRGSPIAGMLFTDANVDHLGGLAVLRQAGAAGFALWSSNVVRDLATRHAGFAPFAEPPHEWKILRIGDEHALDERLVVRFVPLEGTTPGYAGRTRRPNAVGALAVADRVTGGRLLAAPVFAEVGDGLRSAICDADVAFLDGSFYGDDELAALDVEGKSARYLGHLPVGGRDGSLAELAEYAPRTRLIYTHLNNTNPLVDPASPAAHRATALGFEIAYDGLQFEL